MPLGSIRACAIMFSRFFGHSAAMPRSFHATKPTAISDVTCYTEIFPHHLALMASGISHRCPSLDIYILEVPWGFVGLSNPGGRYRVECL